MFSFFAGHGVTKRKRGNTGVLSDATSNSSTISAQSMRGILEKLKYSSHRQSTSKNYLSIWQRFNQFVIKLDVKPNMWEDRVSLFIAHLIEQGLKSTTVKSDVSAIKKTLVTDGYL